jgi:hypothetical protein
LRNQLWNEKIVSYTRGLANELVAGKSTAHEFTIQNENGHVLTERVPLEFPTKAVLQIEKEIRRVEYPPPPNTVLRAKEGYVFVAVSYVPGQCQVL